MEDRMKIIKDFEKLLRSTSRFSDVVITYGGMVYENGESKFVPSDRILSENYDPREFVFVRREGAPTWYGVYQCVEADNGSGLIKDIWKAVNEL